jgi:hypothetical protein
MASTPFAPRLESGGPTTEKNRNTADRLRKRFVSANSVDGHVEQTFRFMAMVT